MRIPAPTQIISVVTAFCGFHISPRQFSGGTTTETGPVWFSFPPIRSCLRFAFSPPLGWSLRSPVPAIPRWHNSSQETSRASPGRRSWWHPDARHKITIRHPTLSTGGESKRSVGVLLHIWKNKLHGMHLKFFTWTIEMIKRNFSQSHCRALLVAAGYMIYSNFNLLRSLAAERQPQSIRGNLI